MNLPLLLILALLIGIVCGYVLLKWESEDIGECNDPRHKDYYDGQ